ncbi:MAG: flagellar assembly factor FliW [Desulfonauticus sp.]|nr:flagellar assembly factor FliW [Desulfonauticus sp.]
MENKIIISSRVGKVVLEKDKIITFPRGLIGFENYQEFVLLQIKDDSPFFLLQNIKNSRLGLIVTDPFLFDTNFSFSLNSIEEKILKIKKREDIVVLVTVNIPPGEPEETTLNFSGPIVINKKARLGLQIALADPKLCRHLKLKDFTYKKTSLAPQI